MLREERETVIVANLADLDEGYFTVETTEPKVLRRLRRLAGDRLEVEGTRPWLCRVPREFWSGFGVRASRAGRAASQNVLRALELGRQTRKQRTGVAATTPGRGRAGAP